MLYVPHNPSPREVHARATEVIHRLIGPSAALSISDGPASTVRIVGRVGRERRMGRRIGLGTELPAGAYVVMFGDDLDEIASVWSVSSAPLRQLGRRDGAGEFGFG